VPHLDWPGVAQVGRIEREREIKGQTSREVAYAVTSLTREQAGPEALLSLVRGHWAIENQLHWRRDVSLREDACRVRSGCAPQALAALRNTVLRLARARLDRSRPFVRPSPRTVSMPSSSPPKAFFE